MDSEYKRVFSGSSNGEVKVRERDDGGRRDEEG